MKRRPRAAAIVGVLVIFCVSVRAAGLSFAPIDLGALGESTSFALANLNCTWSAYLHTGPRRVEGRTRGLTHDCTRSSPDPFK